MNISIDEAIHNLQLHLDGDSNLHDTKLRQAMHLSIEALKREQHRRKYDIHLPRELLPGESREV